MPSCLLQNGKPPTEPILGNPPHTDKTGFRRAYCDNPGLPTLPKYAWTMNIHAVEVTPPLLLLIRASPRVYRSQRRSPLICGQILCPLGRM